MKIELTLPDPEPIEPLLRTLSRQYQQVVTELLHVQRQAQEQGLQQAQQFAQDRDALMAAFERMIGMLAQGQSQQGQEMRRVIQQEVAQPQQQAQEQFVSALQSVKRSLGKLPDSLGEVMDKSFKSRQHQLQGKKPEPAKPDVSGTNRIVAKLDELQQAVVSNSTRSRSRNFGSNY